MKVIKQLKRETPTDKLKKFFRQMPIVAKIIVATYSVAASALLLFTQPKLYSMSSLVDMRFAEVILFLLVGLADLKRQQGKGSFYLLLTFLLKNTILLSSHSLINYFVPLWPILTYCSSTAIIIQYLFFVMVEDALKTPETLKYLFIEPFQLKSRFYPLFFFVFLTITSLRVDLLLPFALAIVFHFARVGEGMTLLSMKLDEKCYPDRLQNLGFLKTGSLQRVLKPLDELTTNDSIILEEK